MNRWTRTAAYLAFAAALPAFDASAAQRTFVSTSGDDAYACSIALPCRGFAKAITVTDPGGELVVLDSGGYGAVTVTQNVTILSPAGVYAGISVFGGTDGVKVMAPATKVVLRGLTINGQGGNNGIRVQAGEVHVENTVISNMAQAGILIEGGTAVRISGVVSRSNSEGLSVLPGAGAVSVLVRDSEFSNNAFAGIGASPTAAGANALVTIERSSVTKNAIGIAAAAGPSAAVIVVMTQSVASENSLYGVSSSGATTAVYVRESAIARNGTGMRQNASGVLGACGANLLVANGTATSGTITTTSCLDVASGGGTVTSIATGAGLIGGPITTTGTIVADAAYLQRRVSATCAAGSSIRTINADGTVVCEADDAGTGTVTSVATGTGLTGGPITAAGTVSIANGGVGTTQLANASVNVAKLDTASTDGRYFKHGGNAFGAATALGTTDNQTLELRANGLTSLKIQPTTADPAHGLNTATPNVVGGWNVNAAYVGVIGATIGGGGGDISGSLRFNLITDHYGTVGGGAGNTAGDGLGTTVDRTFATVGGGSLNIASGELSTIGGGFQNGASGQYSAVGGGKFHTATGDYSTVAGGFNGSATGVGASIGGGGAATCGVACSLIGWNSATGDASTVSGGFTNVASGHYSAVGGGADNVASGQYSIAGGHDSEARGDHSIALGHHAKAYNGINIGHGAIVLADGNDFDFNIGTNNRFGVRATGGVYLVTAIDGTGAATAGVSLLSGDSSWNVISDRAAKANWRAVNGNEVLAKLVAMPIGRWNYQAQSADIEHVGPTAQDFRAAFGLGHGDTTIATVDADGVALAAIQGLNAKLEERLAEKSARIQGQDLEIAELRDRVAQVESLRGELAALKKVLVESLAGKGQLAQR